MIRRTFAAVALVAVVITALPTHAQAPAPAPNTVASPPPGPRYVGQLLDLRNGYVFFSSGEVFKLATGYRVASYDGGTPPPRVRPTLWARAAFDPATKTVVELDVTSHRIPAEASADAIHTFAVAFSTMTPASELAPPADGRAPTGKAVAVTFDVTVPPTTPLSAEIYISTDVSGWDPRAIRANRIDGLHYRVAQDFASGTKFSYRVTRGSSNAVEVGENGLEQPPHQFFVREVDVQVSRVTVYAWADQAPGSTQVAQPGSIPTPFNPNPFANGSGSLFPPSRATPPAGFPTPQPGPPNLPHY
jgi:hypothetical protein